MASATLLFSHHWPVHRQREREEHGRSSDRYPGRIRIDGHGPVGTTPSIKKAWAAEVDGDDTFHPGPAHAEATATVYLRNGTQEQYPEDGDAPWA